MARVTVEDCLEHVDNRFALVLLATRRTRQLLKGASSLVDNAKNKAPVIALREIAADRVRFDKNLKTIMACSPSELKARYGEPKRERTQSPGTVPVSGAPRCF